VKVEFNNKISRRKCENTWRLNNTIPNDLWVIEEIKKEIKKFLELDENENTTHQKLWDRAKAVLRYKFIAINALLKAQKDLK
jgi:hypothetical protein